MTSSYRTDVVPQATNFSKLALFGCNNLLFYCEEKNLHLHLLPSLHSVVLTARPVRWHLMTVMYSSLQTLLYFLNPPLSQLPA